MNDEEKEIITSPTIAFDYIKSNLFRSIRADGVVGAPTPNGHIHMAFYSERHSIPRRVVHYLKNDGILGKVRDIETRNSIVREMDVDVYLTLDTAKSLLKWLESAIEEASKDKGN